MKTDLLIVCKVAAAIVLLSASTAVSSVAIAQPAGQDGWAKDDDPVAHMLIEKERKWATLSCAPIETRDAAAAALVTDLIADDFVGTSPRASLYTKADMMPKTPASTEAPERDCKLLGARLRYFGPDAAVIYGNESAVIKSPDGTESARRLVWTDTFLRRGGKWQIIAVQDMVAPIK